MPWAVDGGGCAPADAPLARAAPRGFASRVFGRDGEGEAGRGRGGGRGAPAGGGAAAEVEGVAAAAAAEVEGAAATTMTMTITRTTILLPTHRCAILGGQGARRRSLLVVGAVLMVSRNLLEPRRVRMPLRVWVPLQIPTPHSASSLCSHAFAATATADESQARLIEAQNARHALELQQPAGARHRT